MKNFKNLINNGIWGKTPNDTDLLAFKDNIKDYKYPNDLIDFIESFNGVEGEVGEFGYISLWPIEDILTFNSQYQNDIIFGQYYFFASNSGIYHYAFKKNDGIIYEIDLYDDSYSKVISNSLNDFLSVLCNSE